jgi:hypothetical protein
MSEVAGLYFAGGVAPTSDGAGGMIVWVGGASSGPVMRGFVLYPGGRPGSPSAYGSPLVLFDELAPGWYLFGYR